MVPHRQLLQFEPPQPAFGGPQRHPQVGAATRGQHGGTGQLDGRTALGILGPQHGPQFRHGAPPGVGRVDVQAVPPHAVGV